MVLSYPNQILVSLNMDKKGKGNDFMGGFDGGVDINGSQALRVRLVSHYGNGTMTMKMIKSVCLRWEGPPLW